MKIGVLGTGMVGTTIASKLIGLGHQVMMGSRTSNNEKALKWLKDAGAGAFAGNFAEAAAFGEILFNCTKGVVSLEVLDMAGSQNLKDKILIDISNPLDFSNGMPPSLTISNTDSLGELIQRTYPEMKVVKAFNTMNCYLMVNPSLVAGDHNVFISGDNMEAKEKVIDLISSFGWKKENIIDLGDITTARGTEQILPIWVRLMSKFNNPMFNFHIVQGQAEVR